MSRVFENHSVTVNEQRVVAVHINIVTKLFCFRVYVVVTQTANITACKSRKYLQAITCIRVDAGCRNYSMPGSKKSGIGNKDRAAASPESLPVGEVSHLKVSIGAIR